MNIFIEGLKIWLCISAAMLLGLGVNIGEMIINFTPIKEEKSTPIYITKTIDTF